MKLSPTIKTKQPTSKLIEDFMARYISKPFTLLDNVVGVELNFNKIFYQPEKLRPVPEILNELAELMPS